MKNYKQFNKNILTYYYKTNENVREDYFQYRKVNMTRQKSMWTKKSHIESKIKIKHYFNQENKNNHDVVSHTLEFF